MNATTKIKRQQRTTPSAKTDPQHTACAATDEVLTGCIIKTSSPIKGPAPCFKVVRAPNADWKEARAYALRFQPSEGGFGESQIREEVFKSLYKKLGGFAHRKWGVMADFADALLPMDSDQTADDNLFALFIPKAAEAECYKYIRFAIQAAFDHAM